MKSRCLRALKDYRCKIFLKNNNNNNNANVSVRPLGNTLEDLNMFAEHLGCEVNVLDRQRFFEIFHTYQPSTFDEVKKVRVYLLMDDKHFDVIKNMTGFTGKNDFCHECNTTYSKKNTHRCPFKCKACKGYDIGCDESNLIPCESCNMDFYGSKCFEEHLRKEQENLPSVVSALDDVQNVRKYSIRQSTSVVLMNVKTAA